MMIAKVLIALVAIEHVYILWIEMFAWTTAGKKSFKSIPEDLFESTRVLAANQGLYNGFLAAGLFWSLFIKEGVWAQNISLFFLGCVITAAIYGGISASKSIFLKQGVPAICAVMAVLFIK